MPVATISYVAVPPGEGPYYECNLDKQYDIALSRWSQYIYYKHEYVTVPIFSFARFIEETKEVFSGVASAEDSHHKQFWENQIAKLMFRDQDSSCLINMLVYRKECLELLRYLDTTEAKGLKTLNARAYGITPWREILTDPVTSLDDSHSKLRTYYNTEVLDGLPRTISALCAYQMGALTPYNRFYDLSGLTELSLPGLYDCLVNEEIDEQEMSLPAFGFNVGQIDYTRTDSQFKNGMSLTFNKEVSIPNLSEVRLIPYLMILPTDVPE